MASVKSIFEFEDENENNTSHVRVVPQDLSEGVSNSSSVVVNIDYAGANQSLLPQHIPAVKYLALKVTKGKPPIPFKVDKANLVDAVKKMAYHINKKAGAFDIIYPVVPGGEEPTPTYSITTKKSPHLQEMLEVFYEQVKSGAS